MNEMFAISLDVGGTSLKSAVVSSEGQILEDSLDHTPIDSSGPSEKIIRTFIKVMEDAFQTVRERQLDIAGIGIGMPGPFDYEKGISLIRDVDKYESIYGLNLKKQFKKRLGLSDHFPILFEVDAWTFLRGEAWKGAGKGYHRIIGITLGTGMGSGFMVDDEIVDSGPGVPKWGWIGGSKYKDGILDDRISRRGIIQRYRELRGERFEPCDVKEIAQKAHAGETHANAVFEETGAILGEGVKPFGEAFGAECIIFGGQIARSYPLMAGPLEKALQPVPSLEKVVPAENIDHSALLGASRFLFKGLKAV